MIYKDCRNPIKQISGIRGPMPSWTKKGTVLSIPDAIAKILAEHIKKEQNKLPLQYYLQ